MNNFEFLKSEIPCEGAPGGVVCVGDVWEDFEATYKILGLDNLRIHYADTITERINSQRVNEWMGDAEIKLIERHGREVELDK